MFTGKSTVIELKGEEMCYPMGYHLEHNKKSIMALIAGFLTITEFHGKKINLICRGSSGAIMATMFALNIPNPSNICMVRKDGESSHSGYVKIDNEAVNVIVDDFICTGATMSAIYNRLCEDNKDIVIDCLCVSGENKKLTFTPRYVVCDRKRSS